MALVNGSVSGRLLLLMITWTVCLHVSGNVISSEQRRTQSEGMVQQLPRSSLEAMPRVKRETLMPEPPVITLKEEFRDKVEDESQEKSSLPSKAMQSLRQKLKECLARRKLAVVQRGKRESIMPEPPVITLKEEFRDSNKDASEDDSISPNKAMTILRKKLRKCLVSMNSEARQRGKRETLMPEPPVITLKEEFREKIEDDSKEKSSLPSKAMLRLEQKLKECLARRKLAVVQRNKRESKMAEPPVLTLTDEVREYQADTSHEISSPNKAVRTLRKKLRECFVSLNLEVKQRSKEKSSLPSKAMLRLKQKLKECLARRELAVAQRGKRETKMPEPPVITLKEDFREGQADASEDESSSPHKAMKTLRKKLRECLVSMNLGVKQRVKRESIMPEPPVLTLKEDFRDNKVAHSCSRCGGYSHSSSSDSSGMAVRGDGDFFTRTIILQLNGYYIDSERPKFCSLPKDAGPCKQSIPRFFYNNATQKCEEFTFGGCQGNENNFVSIAGCHITCAAATSRDLQLGGGGGQMSTGSGGQTSTGSESRSTSKTTTNTGATTTTGGKQTVVNKPQKTVAAGGAGGPLSKRCNGPKQRGPCKKSSPPRPPTQRYFYNTQTKACEQYTYTGCNLENENRFFSKVACIDECIKGKQA